jgi:L-fuconolactonase
MDRHGVRAATVVAHLDAHDPENNERSFRRAAEFPDRFKILANVHLNRPDARAQVQALIGRPGLAGVSYMPPWEASVEWMNPGPLWETIAEAGLAVNFKLPAFQLPRLRELASHYRETPFMLCHLAHPVMNDHTENPHWIEVLRSSDAPNIYVKASGFGYYSRRRWEYPYLDVLPYLRQLAGAYGAGRLMWGSDYPPVLSYMTYRQSLEIVRTHGAFLTETEREEILGGTAARLFGL